MTAESSPGPALDTLPATQIVALLLDAEHRVVPAVRARTADIAAAAELIADRWDSGGRLILVGAGTSGRIAAAQAAELPGTFGLDRSRIAARIAGGVAATDAAEDDNAQAADDLAQLAIDRRDTVIAVAASGSTPYTLFVAAAARRAGAAVIAVTTTPASALSRDADLSVDVDVGEEVLRGSSRLTAGTAQKLALDAMTTAAMARLGRVHGDRMIDVVAANAKLRARAAAIVADIAGVAPDEALTALERCAGDARAAVLVLVTGLEPGVARDRAARHRTLRAALTDATGGSAVPGAGDSPVDTKPTRIRPDH